MSSGTLYGIGIGPGDPELLTLKGLRLLREAAVVFVPATAPGRSYAGTIAASYIDLARQQLVELFCPPLRDRSALIARWTALAHEVASIAAQTGPAVFLTEGDPSLYSTFQYLRLALARDHPLVDVHTVPGVSSASAAAATAGVPLALWDESVALVSGTADPEVVRTALRSFETTVLFKPRAGLPVVATAPAAGGREVTVVQRVGRPEQVVLRGEAALAAAADEYFTLVIVRTVGADEDAR